MNIIFEFSTNLMQCVNGNVVMNMKRSDINRQRLFIFTEQTNYIDYELVEPN